MKKYLITVFICATCLFIWIYLVYFQGFYFHFSKSPTTQIHVTVKDNKIQRKVDSTYENFIIKGVDLPSSTAAERSTDFAIEEDTYLDWFRLIQEMGANTIRVYTIYNDTFYNAFYKYNLDNPEPLYLLQGIQVTDYANNSKEDAYSKDFYYSLKQDAKTAVDIVHGKKIITTNKVKGSGIYRKDISPWVLGYIVGSDWNTDTIAYTNHNDHPLEFHGKYFYTTSDSSQFEVLLANVMDSLISYEEDKYHTQSLITFSSSHDTDPFDADTNPISTQDKYVFIDPNHIRSTQNLKSGYFASYQLSGMHANTRLYLNLLVNHHEMPVVIFDFAPSTSRGTDTIAGATNEVQQGQQIIATYQDILESGCNGGFIGSWQDSWSVLTWNTSFALDSKQTYLWNDIQSTHTGYGILGFRSNENEINGSMKDWPKSASTHSYEGKPFSTFCDETGLFLFIDQKNLPKEKEVLLAFDVTPKSGSKTYEEQTSFNYAVDFILKLTPEKGEYLVHSRYNPTRENYLEQITGQNPFINPPELDDPEFELYSVICQELAETDDTTGPGPARFQTYSSGIFTVGSSLENSLSDSCYSQEGLEIRIPWQLLNFSNPVAFEVHDDYYENFGVEPLKIHSINIGFGSINSDHIPLTSVKLSQLPKKDFEEYLKDSYSIIQSYWREIQ